MSVYGVSNSQTTSYSSASSTTTKTGNKKQSEAVSSEKDKGVVYEPSQATESKKDSSVKDYANIAKKMKAELNSKNQQLQNLVDQLLSKQANKYTSFAQLFEDVKNGKISVDPTTVAQAQKDIADDGYWGVNQTSDRIIEFAKALVGDDPEKAEQMRAAFEKGFKAATKSWGKELPSISQRTYDAVMSKFDDWAGVESKA